MIVTLVKHQNHTEAGGGCRLSHSLRHMFNFPAESSQQDTLLSIRVLGDVSRIIVWWVRILLVSNSTVLPQLLTLIPLRYEVADGRQVTGPRTDTITRELGLLNNVSYEYISVYHPISGGMPPPTNGISDIRQDTMLPLGHLLAGDGHSVSVK